MGVTRPASAGLVFAEAGGAFVRERTQMTVRVQHLANGGPERANSGPACMPIGSLRNSACGVRNFVITL